MHKWVEDDSMLLWNMWLNCTDQIWRCKCVNFCHIQYIQLKWVLTIKEYLNAIIYTTQKEMLYRILNMYTKLEIWPNNAQNHHKMIFYMTHATVYSMLQLLCNMHMFEIGKLRTSFRCMWKKYQWCQTFDVLNKHKHEMILEEKIICEKQLKCF